ncbi:S8 family serine peptidase [Propionibacteriaceae bacterium Y1685]
MSVPPSRRRTRAQRLASGRAPRLASGLTALTLGLAGATVPIAAPAHAAPEWSPTMCAAWESSDPGLEVPWHMDRLGYDNLDMLGIDGSGVTIAVIDSGVNPTASALYEGSDITVENFAQVLDNDQYKNKDGDVVGLDCMHGSFVVGMLAAQPGVDSRSKFRGIAPGASVIAMRALEGSTPAVSRKEGQSEPLEPTIEAVDAAVEAGVDIINISQQGPESDPEFARAIARAVDAGILVVAAAGNQGPGAGNSYPAAYPGVMAVGMTTNTDAAEPRSQSGPDMEVSVAAPGAGVVAGVPLCVVGVDNGCNERPDDGAHGAYLNQTGTSFAAPLVAGAAALVMERYPDMTAEQVKKRLEDTADPTGAASPDKVLGHGIINPYRALVAPFGADQQPSTTPAPPEPSRYAPPPKDDNSLQRNIALGVAGTALGVVGVAAVVTAALPSGRSRRWRPAKHE